MIVLVNGIPLFSQRLVDDLRATDKKNKYYFFDTYNSGKDKLLFLLLLPFSKLVISMNGVTDKSGSLDWVLRFRKKLILQWMGTDSIMAMERYKNGTIYRGYIDYASNFVDSEWLYSELKSIELNPVTVPFKYGKVQTDVVKHYKQLSVVSYVGDSRQEFYGIKQIAELAKSFSDVAFHLYGIKESIVPLTDNVICHGWQPGEIFQEALKTNPVCLRLTEHDGFSVTVIEALSFGAEVIWSLPSERTYLAQTTEEVAKVLTKVLEDVKARGMTPNEENIAYANENYNKEKIMSNYVKVLNEH